MRTCKTAVEVAKAKDDLIVALKNREELRNEKTGLGRKKNSLKVRLGYATANEDNAKIDYLKSFVKTIDNRIDEISVKIKALTSTITQLRRVVHYYERNSLTLTPIESSLCYQMFGKTYRELTKTEKSQYEMALRRQKKESGK